MLQRTVRGGKQSIGAGAWLVDQVRLERIGIAVELPTLEPLHRPCVITKEKPERDVIGDRDAVSIR